jgi:death-on-curing protein
MNHPFIDGNKRTSYVLMRLVLLDNDLDVRADQMEKFKMVISASRGEMRFDEIRNWIQIRLKKRHE